MVGTRWLPGHHPATSSDVTGAAVIELMLCGAFRMRCSRGDALGDTNSAVLFNAGEVYEISHPVARPNRGVSIRVDQRAAAWAGDVDHGDFEGPGVRLSAAALVDAHRVMVLLARTDREPMEIEETIAALIGHCRGLRPDGGRSTSANAARRVERAREVLNAAFADRLTLQGVAAEVGCSPWQLSRDFTRVTGVRMHRYLCRLRVRAAVGMLLRRRDLTALALSVGFSSHSHFTAAFRQEFGVPPSAVRVALMA